MARRSSRPPRRGVVLLVILSLLVLFALLGVTFVIVSGQYKRSAGSYMRAETYGDDWSRQADTAMYYLLRDGPATDSANVLRTHSLLNDLYGHDFYYGTVGTPSATPPGGGQLLQFDCSLANAAGNPPTDAAGYFNGCVITFFRPLGAAPNSNQFAGISSRILGSSTDSGVTTLLVMRPTADDASNVTLSSGDRFIINGRPFSGTGTGFNVASGKLDREVSGGGEFEALFPVRVGEDISQVVTNYLAGGANESFDAADLQNLFLSATIPDATNAAGIRSGTNALGQPVFAIIPSFHRPALINYMRAKDASNLTNAAILRKFCFRPMPGVTANANFPPLPDPVNGPWDVDNNGDGIPDSVWVDINLPVQTTADGRRYKPVVALHIADMDNRINVNFQGNEQHYNPAPVAAGMYLADGSQTNAFPVKGVGMGPAEVVLGSGTELGLRYLSTTQYQQLLSGTVDIPGRYGFDQVAGSGASGTPTAINPGADPVASTRYYEIPANYFNVGAGGGSYQSPPDFTGQLARGVSPQGAFVSDVPQDTASDLRARATYRTRGVHDRRFTPAELERILRYYDIDYAQLPSRLEALAGVLSGSSADASFNRQIVTTESRDMPVARATVTKSVNDSMGGNKQGFRDPVALLRKRLGSAMISEAQLLKLVDRDFYFGLKMNLNRPLGDGQDSNGNQVVDEPIASEINPVYGAGFDAVNGDDVNGDGTVDISDQVLVRHQFAKHLYILASLCVDTGNTPDQNVQHQLAQWAINVVDFRDADAIMTPFEYDPNPFDGWNSACEGNIAAGEPYDGTRRLVWGCERPELLLSETLALHDRRTSDTADEDPVAMDEADMKKKEKRNMPSVEANRDASYDQKYLPEGSAFIELYNPWQSKVDRVPAELYFDWANNSWTNGVRLDQTTPDGGSPVWRLLVVKGDKFNVDPDELDPTRPQLAPDDKDRCVYFTNPAGVTDASEVAGKPYFPAEPTAPVLPGRYAVIGSGPSAGVGNPPKYVTYLGFKTEPPDITSHDDTVLGETRQIELKPSTDPSVNQVRILNNNHMDLTEPDYGNLPIQPTVAVVINRTTDGMATTNARFSISEPTNGYPAGTPAGNSGLSLLPAVLDKPLDDESIRRDGMIQTHRIVHLQRLANPLLPHNKTTNPYITIDTTGSDLVCFNGIEGGDEPGADGGANTSSFETLQRGDHPPQPANPLRQLWRRSTSQQVNNEAADTTHFAGFPLRHSLGYLNTSYGDYVTTDSAQLRKGDPSLANGLPTFPWLTFNNRPFNSIYELMEVPMTKASALTDNYQIPPGLTAPYPQNQQNHAFGHLFNFYYEYPRDGTSGAPQPTNPQQVNGLYRLFDYLRIPSKYVEADTMLVAANFTGGTLAQNQFHPPYNWLSNYRDPGTININTIYSANVWNAILGGDPLTANPAYGLGPSFDKIIVSRRGYGGSNDIFERDPTIPTEFGRPFRAAGEAHSGNTSIDPVSEPFVNDTLLRKDPTTGFPLLGNNNTQAYNHSARHPYFRHQTLQRLSNTLTTRSNVYAVWITVGYFEVDGSGLLGQELHADTGEVKRHRAFYMIDRSIPVGFEPGENHNVDRAILVRRYIE